MIVTFDTDQMWFSLIWCHDLEEKKSFIEWVKTGLTEATAECMKEHNVVMDTEHTDFEDIPREEGELELAEFLTIIDPCHMQILATVSQSVADDKFHITNVECIDEDFD